jgi:predicted nucleic acid-binding Zn ribbon protein
MLPEEHRHCVICDKVIAPDKKVCGKKCQAELDARLNKKKMLVYLLYAGAAVFLLILILQLAGLR